MANITIYFDVADEPVMLLDNMNKLNNCIFPIDNGKCVKWTHERGEEDGEET